MALTILFTEVDGSAAAARRLGSEWSWVLADHRAALTAAAFSHGGRVLDREGERCAFEFADQAAALGAAIDGQRSLAKAQVSVRMGVHAGPVEAAAAVAGAAHGGQVVVAAPSDGDALPAGAWLIDLGDHQLRGFLEPVPLAQLGHADLGADFPPLRAARVRRHNLPMTPPLIGRARAVSEVLDLIRANNRLVTLTGVGGSGKSRLALEVARHLADGTSGGVWLLELGGISDPDLVPGLVDNVLAEVDDDEAVVVMDGCDHQRDACGALLPRLLRRMNGLAVLATSRTPLNLAGETVWAVPPLDEAGANALFLARAGRSDPTLVARLDRMPLTLELAAANPGADATEIDRAGIVAWCYAGLAPAGQRLFDRLGVFAGRFSSEDADAVARFEAYDLADGLAGLVDRGLVDHDRSRVHAPYRLLDPLREFARARLIERGELEEAADRLLGRMVDLAGATTASRRLTDQVAALPRVDVVADNLRAALEWGCTRPAMRELGARLAASSWGYWRAKGLEGEGLLWLDRAARGGAGVVSVETQGAVLRAMARLRAPGDPAEARRLLGEAMAVCSSAGDRAGVALTWVDRAGVEMYAGDFDEADRAAAQAIELGDAIEDADERRDAMAVVRRVRAVIAGERGALDEAAAALADVAADDAGAGAMHGAGANEILLAFVELERGELESARVHGERSAEIHDELGLMCDCVGAVEQLRAYLALAAWDLDEAERRFAAAVDHFVTIDAVGAVPEVMVGLGETALSRGDIGRAATLLAAAGALQEQYGMPFMRVVRHRWAAATESVAASLDASVLAAAEAAGRALTVDDLLAELADLDLLT